MCIYCERRTDVRFGWKRPSLPIRGNVADERTKACVYDYQTADPELIVTDPTLGEALWGKESGGVASYYLKIKYCPECGRRLGTDEEKCPTDPPGFLKWHRERNGLTLDGLSAITGISRVSLSRYENGKRNIGLAAFAKVVRALKVPPCDVVSLVFRKATENRNEKQLERE